MNIIEMDEDGRQDTDEDYLNIDFEEKDIKNG